MMTYKGYRAVIFLDHSTPCYGGYVAGIRDVVTFMAESADGLEQAFHDSVDDYLEFCRQGDK